MFKQWLSTVINNPTKRQKILNIYGRYTQVISVVEWLKGYCQPYEWLDSDYLSSGTPWNGRLENKVLCFTNNVESLGFIRDNVQPKYLKIERCMPALNEKLRVVNYTQWIIISEARYDFDDILSLYVEGPMMSYEKCLDIGEDDRIKGSAFTEKQLLRRLQC